MTAERREGGEARALRLEGKRTRGSGETRWGVRNGACGETCEMGKVAACLLTSCVRCLSEPPPRAAAAWNRHVCRRTRRTHATVRQPLTRVLLVAWQSTSRTSKMPLLHKR